MKRFSLSRMQVVIAALPWLTTVLLNSHAFADAANYRRTLQSTAWVLSKNSEGTSSGTGVLIDAEKKLLVTNAHVVGDSRSAVIFFPAMKNDAPIVERSHYLENVEKLGVRGTVVAVDRQRDLALVQLSKIPEGATAVAMAEGSASPGEDVESIGNSGTSDALWVYASGTVRAVYKKQFRTGAGEHDFKVVETQAPINSGDSGGPVVNSEGKLVAVSQAISPKARLLSYCVDISEVKRFLLSPWKPAPLPVKELLDFAELKYERHTSGHYQIEMEVKEKKDAKQLVFVTKDVESYERADVRKIWSLATTLKEQPSAETAMKLLQLNARTKIGSWTVEKNEAGEFMVLYVVKMDATASHDAVKSTLEYVATLTDSMKNELSPKEEAKTAEETLNKWLAN